MSRPRSGIIVALLIILAAVALGATVHPLLFVLAVLALLFIF